MAQKSSFPESRTHLKTDTSPRLQRCPRILDQSQKEATRRNSMRALSRVAVIGRGDSPMHGMRPAGAVIDKGYGVGATVEIRFT